MSLIKPLLLIVAFCVVLLGAGVFVGGCNTDGDYSSFEYHDDPFYDHDDGYPEAYRRAYEQD